jgi:hypothetical protein
VIAPAAAKALRKLPRNERERILMAILGCGSGERVCSLAGGACDLTVAGKAEGELVVVDPQL